MKWGQPDLRRFSIVFYTDESDGRLSTSRLATDERGARRLVHIEYPGCRIVSCQPMFQKGDPK